jgi:hypothetical protein
MKIPYKSICRLFEVVFYIGISSGLSFSQTFTEQSLDKIKKATVFVNVKHQFVLTNDELNTSGSGFFINDMGWIATNYHVIQSSLSDYNTLYPTKIKEIKIICNSGTSDYKSYDATIISIDKDNDLAILAVQDSTNKFPFVEIDTSRLNELTPVRIFGYPFGDQFTVLQRGPEITASNGAISALRHDDLNELTKIQVDGVVNHGNSGGPVVNESGKVVGIISSMLGESRINFAVPVHYLRSLIKTIPLNLKLSEMTHLKIKTNPADAEVFVDGEGLFSKEGYKDDFRSNGLHTLVAMKKGYECYIKQVSLTGNYTEPISLVSEKNITVPILENAENKSPCTATVSNSEEILLKENFEDPKRFETWEQSTGGEKTRTWYMEDGKLKQFENNGILHAIYLGDKNWENYTVKARVKITNEGGEQNADSRAGIIFRETENGFYLLRIHQESNKVQLAYHSKSPFGWFIITEKELQDDVEVGKWYTLSASVNNSVISCFLNGKNLFNVSSFYSSGGRVGFYSVESKPVFDSLTVVKTNSISADNLSQVPTLVSFWFSDNFDLRSNWWYQYKTVEANEGDAREELCPMYMVDGSFAITEETGNAQTMEFAKYKLKDFTMNLNVSLDEGKDNAVFEIFIRKDGGNLLAFRFNKNDKTVSLVQYQNGKEKILRSKELSSQIFHSALSLQVKADGNTVSISSLYSELLGYDSKNIPTNAGRIGFSSKGVRIAFHQLTVSSIAQLEGRKKNKK